MMAALSSDALHALQIGIQNELDTIHIYQKMLEKVKSRPTQAVLRRLIEEELSHKNRMKKKIEESNSQVPETDFEFPELPNREQLLELEFENCTVTELIDLAIENEKISRDFYKAQRDRAKHEDIAEIFQWLFREEQQHISNLEKEQSAHSDYGEVEFPDV